MKVKNIGGVQIIQQNLHLKPKLSGDSITILKCPEIA
jgi:hypothetical protein